MQASRRCPWTGPGAAGRLRRRARRSPSSGRPRPGRRSRTSGLASGHGCGTRCQPMAAQRSCTRPPHVSGGAERPRRDAGADRCPSNQMSRQPAYGSPAAFRRALTDRLRTAVHTTPWSLPHLQRQIAYDRLLERLYLVEGTWVVKGAIALIARPRRPRDRRCPTDRPLDHLQRPHAVPHGRRMDEEAASLAELGIEEGKIVALRHLALDDHVELALAAVATRPAVDRSRLLRSPPPPDRAHASAASPRRAAADAIPPVTTRGMPP
jgi:hypothetical protein